MTTITPITLNKIKEYLNIDFSDFDTQLTAFLEASISLAEAVSGLKSENFNAEIWNGVLFDVRDRFDLGSSYVATENVIAIFRRNSRKPML